MRLMAILAIVLVLTAMVATPAAAVSIGTSTATISVNSDISVTIQDGGAANIVFGALNAGTTNNPDTTANETIPSIRLTVAGTSIVDLQVSGTDFVAGFAVSNAKFNTSYTPTGATAMNTSVVQIASAVSPGSNVDVWFWLDVPASGVLAGDYSSTFTFEAIEHS
jgi:hypothetical protein